MVKSGSLDFAQWQRISSWHNRPSWPKLCSGINIPAMLGQINQVKRI